MLLKKKFLISFILYFTFFGFSYAKENYYNEAKKKFDNNDLESSKFLFQKNIVFNPKDAKSYLYLAKIFNIEDNEKEEEKNLDTTLLLDPSNEEAMYMLIDIELKRSNFSKVEELKKDFKIICSKMCKKITSINNRLKEFEKKDAS